MDTDLERFDYRGYRVRIVPDEDPPNPRKDWDHLATMVCLHGRYELGDVNKLELEEANELEARIRKEGGAVLPLYLYDHSGITISTKPFSCPWDSGRLGFIYVERDKFLQEWGFQRYPELARRKAEDLMRAEVEEYDRYLTGGFVGWIIEDADGEHLDSCWGYDDSKPAISDAKARVRSLVRARRVKRIEDEASVGSNPT